MTTSRQRVTAWYNDGSLDALEEAFSTNKAVKRTCDKDIEFCFMEIAAAVCLDLHRTLAVRLPTLEEFQMEFRNKLANTYSIVSDCMLFMRYKHDTRPERAQLLDALIRLELQDASDQNRDRIEELKDMRKKAEQDDIEKN